MIYWPMKPGTTMTIAFPNSYGFAAAGWEEDLFLEIRNDVGRWVINGEWGYVDVTANYFISYWDVPEGEDYPWPDGEYTYYLRRGEDGPIVSQGILFIGNFDGERNENENTTIYDQYGEQIID